MALRCFFKNLPMLCPIPIGPLFYQGFYTKDGLDFPLAHGHRSVRPTCLGPSGLVFCFYPLQLPLWSHLVRHFLRKGANWGDGQINHDGLMFMGWRMRYRHERWQMTTVNTEWTVSQSTRWWSELYSWQWRGSLDDGLWSMRPSGVQRSNKLPEAFKAYNTCRSSIGLYLGSKCRFVFRALHL